MTTFVPLSTPMPYKLKDKTIERERLVQEAIAGIKSTKYKSAYDAAKQLGINENTIRNRVMGMKTRAQAREPQQHLTIAEERSLIRWIKHLAATGHPAKHAYIKEMAEELRHERVMSQVNSLNTLPIFGISWVSYFLRRHPELQTVLSRSIEINRVSNITLEVVENWFNDFTMLLEEKNITLENVYNMDESGKLASS